MRDFLCLKVPKKKEEGISLKYKVSQDYGKPIFERSTFTTDGEVTIDDHTISIESINIETQPDTTFNSDSIDRMESVTKTLSSQLGISK